MKRHTQAGREAYHAGRGIDACPYRGGDSRRVEWLKGWLEADGYEIGIFMSALSEARQSGNFSTHMTEGFQAFQTGTPLQDNPYGRETFDSIEWAMGWMAGFDRGAN